MRPYRLLLALLATVVLVACGSSRKSAIGDAPKGAGVDSGLPVGQSLDSGGAPMSLGGDGSSGGMCEAESTAAGCPCTGSATVSCWTGPPANQNLGQCRNGTQTCMVTTQGEFSQGTWGPCTGEVLDCGTDAGVDSAISEDSGPVLVDSGVDSGPVMVVSGEAGIDSGAPVSDSCRHLALTYGSANFPATVCLLAGGNLECAVNPEDPATGVSTPLLPDTTLSNLDCISGGEDFFCVVTSSGGVTCWGDQAAFDPSKIGSQPLGQYSVSNETLDVPGLPTNIVDIAAGETHLCVLTSTGTVICWGSGLGEVNTGSWPLSPSPTAVTGLGGTAIDIASGDGFSCALRSDGTVFCWGNNSTGQLGNGGTTMSATPVQVMGLPTTAVGVWADQASYPCALLKDNSVWCWGSGALPAQVTGFSSSVTALTTGGEFDANCALLSTGSVECWSATSTPAAILPAGSGVVELRSIDYDYCALLTGGSVTCWYNSGISEWTPTAPETIAF
jgi:hypothetical protein